jgi:nucleoside-diphosphate-sugar epimerase
MSSPETVLVTGGAGFIGSHLVERLLQEGYRVRILDNFSTGSITNLAHLQGFELIKGDIRQDADLQAAVAGVDYILHQAALGSVPRSIDDPLTTHECNSTGTLKVLLAARAHQVRRVVYASSSSVYGDTPTLPKLETMPPRPLSPYALSKLSGEIHCQLFTRLYGLETVSLRYFNVFGPRQSANSQYAAVIPRFAGAMLAGQPATVYGDGEQTRDFTYVANVVTANLLAMQSTKAVGKALNIAGGARYSVNYLANLLATSFNLQPQLVYSPPRLGDIRDSYADIQQAARSLRYQPVIDFATGISITAKWFQQALAVMTSPTSLGN